MRYIHNQEVETIQFEIDDISNCIGDKLIDSQFVIDFNDNLHNILRKNDQCAFYSENKNILDIAMDKICSLLKNRTERLRNNILNKYLLSENLHFLMSNGCSLYAGSKAINTMGDSNYIKLLTDFKLPKKYVAVQSQIKQLKDERPEIILDKLYEILSFYQNIMHDTTLVQQIDKLIINFKKAFFEEFILTVDYNKNYWHKLLFKRVISRNIKLSKVNFFTLNYDLLIEKTAEELNINVNNGFLGFHNRVFMPSAFHLDIHLNYSDGYKASAKGINLFKLHGSISWKFDDTKPPYGITEIQQNFSQNSNGETVIGIPANKEVPDCIIYPVQAKKKHALDLPYSEMFRQFIEFTNRPNSTLIIMGYSFLDEHVNDIITNALSNPDFNLLVFSYQDEDDGNISEYLKRLFTRSREDSRISMFAGRFLGDFEYIVKYLMPYPQKKEASEIIFDTFQKMRGEER